MPNHFLTIGLCSRGHNRDVDEVDFSKLEKANLCELAGPKLPDELSCIVSSSPLCRYVHKETGEIFKSCNGPEKDRDQYKRVDLTTAEVRELKSKYGAADWFEWCNENWGTKWGAYDTKVHELGGDGSPVMIEFQSAWGPPNATMMTLITKYLCENYDLTSIKWIGHDPSDGSIDEVEMEAV